MPLMDKPISNEVHVKRRKIIILYSLLLVVGLGSAAWLLRSTLKPSLKRSEITTSIVEMGNIENTLNASGEVLPEFEEILSSPITASIRSVTLDAGSHVQAGQSILTLDKAATQSEYEKLKFQLESKRNNIQKLKLELDKSFYDLKANNEIKQLRINSLKSCSRRCKTII
jgi:HlyD family secretion protein